MKLYGVERVERLETTPEFRAALDGSTKRKAGARVAVATKRSKALDWVDALEVVLEPEPFDKVQRRVIDAYLLEVHDYPPVKVSLKHDPAMVALVSEYSTGPASVAALFKNTIEYQDGADGRVFVGGGGRGYLNMTGGSLTGTAFIVGGEQLTTGNGTSRADIGGNSIVTISGPAT
ncbi:hypothetical protein B4Q13_23210, partial [Lacticaseibacillus rhamnosus]